MAYFKINNIDFSPYVNTLKVNNKKVYNAQTNAAGNTVVDYINAKKELEVGFIPMEDGTVVRQLLTQLDKFNLSISYRDPNNAVFKTINCIIPEDNIDYYTIRADRVMYKTFTLKFIEL